jgi:hypothetical protein
MLATRMRTARIQFAALGNPDWLRYPEIQRFGPDQHAGAPG